MERTIEHNEAVEFIDDPTIPQYPIEGLHDVDVRGAICEIIPFSYRKTAGGILIKQASHTCIVPVAAIGGMIALVVRKIGGVAFTSTVEATARALRLQ